MGVLWRYIMFKFDQAVTLITTTSKIKHCQIHVHLFWIILVSITGHFTVAKHARNNVISFCRNVATDIFDQRAWVEMISFFQIAKVHIKCSDFCLQFLVNGQSENHLRLWSQIAV